MALNCRLPRCSGSVRNRGVNRRSANAAVATDLDSYQEVRRMGRLHMQTCAGAAFDLIDLERAISLQLL